MIASQFPRIRCARCNKLVDEVRVHYDLFDLGSEISVSCHGAADVMRLDYFWLQNLNEEEREQLFAIARGEIEGVAFVDDKLPPPAEGYALP